MNALDFAINMEIDARKYYLEQAEKNESRELKSVFHMLADEEHIHEELLKSKADDLPYELNDVHTEFENGFRGLDDFHNDIKFIPDALDAYQFALKREKESAALYKKMFDEAANDDERRLYHYLVRQENEHASVLEELITLVRNSVEWVENAEFGLRGDY